MNEELAARIERVKQVLPLNEVYPQLKIGTNTCLLCNKPAKLSVWQAYCKCWSSSCVLNRSHDLISLYQVKEGVEFYDALTSLESLAGITPDKGNERSSFLESVLQIYVDNLFGASGKVALEYLESRGFYQETLQMMRVGFAPKGTPLLSAGLDSNKLKEFGLLEGRREYYTNRIIFPIRNTAGSLVHFTGRYLGQVPKDEAGEDILPRYKDSKGKVGLGGIKSYLVFEEYLKNYQTAYFAEGYPDALTLFQRGLPALGLLGLEKLLTHAYKLKHLQEITFIFDNDQFPIDHLQYPLEYKSWRRVVPQLLDLQLLLPNTTFYTWLVPEVEGKDINDWCLHNRLDIKQTIHQERKEFVTHLISTWGNELSNHGVLLKLIASTGRGREELVKYIRPEYTPIEYALIALEG